MALLWAVDPILSLGLVNRRRSDLFRLGERAAAARSDADALPDHLLTSAELDELRASLTDGGLSDKGLLLSNGTWSLASGTQPRPAPALDSRTFAEWPWEQQLQLTPDMPYSRAGKLLLNMLRFCNKHCTCPVMMMMNENRTCAAYNLFD